ncbi:excinuclease ABC subunit UvrA [Patescibacteria group bacterium]|nr:excinuclease ABC subunit UvrA [Patescibacteria group bacterium]
MSDVSVIKIKGARVHNLKNVSLDIPKTKLVVVTGPSGSGKSSLAFDVLYAEAERRFVESLSSYARQFLGVQDKPDVDAIEGLSPAISIDQKSVSRNPRSTVGTITEIYDYLRILFSRVGKPHCPQCGKPIGKQTVDQITDRIRAFAKQEIIILAPLVSGKKGEHKHFLEEVRQAGFLRVRLDGELYVIEDAEKIAIDKKKKHSLEVVVDRFVLNADIDRSRIASSVETALKIGKGIVIAAFGSPHSASDKRKDIIFSEHFACSECGISIPDLEPRIFSFNSPYGACSRCMGLGSTLEVKPELVIPNTRLTIAEGAIRPWASASHRVGRQSWYWWILSDLAERKGFSLNTPVAALSKQVLDLILYGESGVQDGEQEKGKFEGVIPNLKRRWKETDSEWTRKELEKYMVIQVCPACSGKRLKPEVLGITVGGKNIAEVSAGTIEETKGFFDMVLKPREKIFRMTVSQLNVASPLVKEIQKRLQFLIDVGLHYLTIERESTSLSGGEAQRIRLATQIGSRLTGILYILDEPSIGLHQRDQARLIKTLKDLRNLGNTVIVVEHDPETMRSADWIVDLGPGAGKHGGEIIFEGTAKELLRSRTLTGDYLSGRKKIDIRGEKSKVKSQKSKIQVKSQKYLVIKGAREHNLKNINVAIPLEKFVVVTGVSGSGKSTLINDILARSLMAEFYRSRDIPGAHDSISGTKHLDKVVVVDQSPIGRTPRSNPATYTGMFGAIRTLFASMPEAKVRGYGPGRFSFNVKGGRCETCEGQGVKKIEMYFLPDVFVECEECKGARYNQEALAIEYDGMNIAAVLDLTIEDALKFFKHSPAIVRILQTLFDVGLGYMKLGQPAITLSGGEAQRVKLATELSRKDTGHSLYILDEPTTGLHFDDIKKLLFILDSLVKKGNSALVIEHNLDVIKNADWIIDLGPEGGDAGGKIVAEGTPEEIAGHPASYTGKWLKKVL